MFSLSGESSESSVAALQVPGSCSMSAFMEHYEFMKVIGRGGYGQVSLALHRLSGAQVAVKTLALEVGNIPAFNEPKIMMSLEHPNVVQLFHVIGTESTIYMVMEHVGGGRLLEHITRGMQVEEVQRVFRQIVCAVGYCHDKGIVHRDLKPENIMLDTRGNVKLIDFGAATWFRAGEKLRRFWGTLPYLAPESVLRQEYEGPPVDVWSLGVILYFMLTQSLPFNSTSSEDLLMRITHTRYNVPDSVPVRAGRLIHSILTVKPPKRPTVKQISRHPWLKQDGERVPQQHSEALPKHPDPQIMALLVDNGLDPYQTWVSLAKRKFDARMANYLILQHQKSQGVECMFPGKPVPRRVRLSSCPAGLSRGPVLPRRSTSEPALQALPLPHKHQLPEAAKQPGQVGIRRASLPALPLDFHPAEAPPPDEASQSHSVSYLPNRWKRLLRLVETVGISSFQDESPEQPREPRKSWTRRIADYVQRLCCCMPRVRNRVFPRVHRRSEPEPDQ
ncbi:sperm motility kinase 2B-like [Marmota marmota marmota]|uniref:sperm motility kinase 2B-like n=1 Tax=Marmota marmota marmota TaxID=9994 RepID=UPI002093FFA3|nr:sperm motility kinase 2B-like [Marmota marmota marmota]